MNRTDILTPAVLPYQLRLSFSGSGTRLTRILSVKLGEQLPLLVPLREQEEDDCCSQQDCDDPCEVGPLGASLKRRLRRSYDLVRILRILLREVGNAGE
jgi:hypothetical protein